MIRHLPNCLTLANLFCGCIGIVMVARNDLQTASYLILLAALFDFLDGFAAKLLNAASAIGKDLDSLADMVTFGLLPSFMLYSMMETEFNGTGWEVLSYAGFLVALFSALRLAKFNNDPRQSDRFIGLPTPANTLLISSIPHFPTGNWAAQLLTDYPWIFVFLSAGLSYLLVAELPLLALKFKGFKWAGNERRYLLIAASAVLLISFQWIAVPFIFALYLILSLSERTNA